MIGNIFKVLISVKAKLFFGFLSMAVIIALLGGYAFTSIGGAGSVVKDTYDRPLMAINFARSASQVFSNLELEVVQRAYSDDGVDALSRENIDPFLDLFKEDLAIAKERSISPRAASYFADVEKNLALWEGLIFQPRENLDTRFMAEAQSYADAIEEQLDIIVELQTNESFRAREQSIAEMERIKRYNLMAVSAALLITLLLSAWIAVTIINPLKAAARAAAKISAGNFNVDIPAGGDDETGVLLKTMSAMQKNIRTRVGQEQNLRALAQHRLSDSLRNSKDAILLTDQNGMIIVANPQVGQIFPALDGIDLVGRPFTNFFHDMGRSRTDPSQYSPDTAEIVFEDGRWARVAASATQEGGRLYIWNDITESKQYSETLRTAKEEAEAADKAKTLFLAAMSHELRTPLNAVIGFSDILEAAYKGPEGNPDHAEMAGLISQSGAQLLNIVQDVLTVANGTQSGEMAMKMDAVDLNDVATFCIKTIAGEAQKGKIRLIWSPGVQGEMMVSGDVLRLQQLLLNLLSNAVKYNQSGGAVKVQITREAGPWIRLDVIDNGIGIPQEDLTRIMEPFVQVDIGHTRKYDGVGLGLTIVQKILTAHEGQIKIKSTLDKGTAVSIYLPALTMPQSSHVRHSA